MSYDCEGDTVVAEPNCP